MDEAKGIKTVGNDEALKAVPLSQRQHWLTPAMIFGGLEFTIPVLMIGATLTASYGMGSIFWILVIGLIVFQWVGNSIQGFIGAKTGRSSSVIAKSSFGSVQARFIVGLTIFIVSLGWWALQTAVAGNAIAAMFGIDYEKQWGLWAVITVVAGVLFAIPSIIGYSSMKWTDYIAVPAGLALIAGCIFYALRNTGWETITAWNPEPKITFLAAISLVIGANVSQWVIASDYTRYAKPRWRDNILIPLGIVAVGFPLFYVGSIMSVGVGDADIVNVMLNLGFPVWGFLVLWFATWTSQLVNNYSMGLALANMFNINSSKGRAFLTFLGTILAIIIALAGILDYFTDFLYLTALIYPAIGGIMMADFFIIRKQRFEDNKGWNWMATIALVCGTFVGYLTQYVYEFGLPAVQSIIISAFIYWIAMKIKAKIKPDHFTGLVERHHEGFNKEEAG